MCGNLPSFAKYFSCFFTSIYSCYFGTSVVNIILKYIPDVVMHGLEVSGGMLPALGFALIIHMIGKEPVYSIYVNRLFPLSDDRME